MLTNANIKILIKPKNINKNIVEKCGIYFIYKQENGGKWWNLFHI